MQELQEHGRVSFDLPGISIRPFPGCRCCYLPLLPQLACSILATWGSLIVHPCRTQGNSYNIQMMHVFTFWSTHSCLNVAGFPLQFSNVMDNVLLKEEYAVSISVLSAYALGVCTAFSFITPSRRSFLAYLQRKPLSGWWLETAQLQR